MSDLMELMKIQLEDIHHTRNQEWTILAMIGISFYFLSQAANLAFRIVAIVFGIATCIIGIAVSIKHWAIFYRNIKIMHACEERLGIKIERFKSSLVVQGLIIILYFWIIGIFSGLLLWLLLENYYVSLIIGVLVATAGVVAYIPSKRWAEKKKKKTKVDLSPELLK